MKSTPCCPECSKILSTRKERCRCGWKLPVIKQNEKFSDGRCEYRVHERRCPLPGTICAFPYGNSPWYCTNHWCCLDDPRLSEAVLLHAEKNYHEILAARSDWRDVLLAERGIITKTMHIAQPDTRPSTQFNSKEKTQCF